MFPLIVHMVCVLCALYLLHEQVLRLDPAAAVGTYERALAVDPSLGNVWFNLANAHLKLDQQEEAARWCVTFRPCGSLVASCTHVVYTIVCFVN